MKKILLFSLTYIVLIAGCKNRTDKLKVENRLPEKIVCVLGYNYPDIKLNFINKKALLANTGLFQIDSGETKEIDTSAGLCRKDVWNKYVKQSLLILFVFDEKKLIHAKNLEDALIERYYFSYIQLIRDKGIIVAF